jgi:hypothetical protein
LFNKQFMVFHQPSAKHHELPQLQRAASLCHASPEAPLQTAPQEAQRVVVRSGEVLGRGWEWLNDGIILIAKMMKIGIQL